MREGYNIMLWFFSKCEVYKFLHINSLQELCSNYVEVELLNMFNIHVSNSLSCLVQGPQGNHEAECSHLI